MVPPSHLQFLLAVLRLAWSVSTWPLLTASRHDLAPASSLSLWFSCRCSSKKQSIMLRAAACLLAELFQARRLLRTPHATGKWTTAIAPSSSSRSVSTALRSVSRSAPQARLERLAVAHDRCRVWHFSIRLSATEAARKFPAYPLILFGRPLSLGFVCFVITIESLSQFLNGLERLAGFQIRPDHR